MSEPILKMIDPEDIVYRYYNTRGGNPNYKCEVTLQINVKEVHYGNNDYPPDLNRIRKVIQWEVMPATKLYPDDDCIVIVQRKKDEREYDQTY